MGRSGQVTMKEVAERAGVSRSAVSAAFSERKSTIVLSDATRQRIREIAAEMGYQRNMLAQMFIKQKSYTIGFLGNEAYYVFALPTIKGIEKLIEQRDYSLLTYYNGGTAAEQARHLQRSLDRHVDGLIAVVAPEGRGGALSQRLLQLFRDGFPIVQIYERVLHGIPVVMTDDRAVGRLATRHLIELGHRRIVHVTHPDYRDQQLPGQNLDALLRWEGYEQAMREAGLEPVVLTHEPIPGAGIDFIEAARGLARQVIDHPAHFTAATTFCDYTAIGLMAGLREAGVRVPEDFSLVGYDDIEGSAFTQPGLTTLRQPFTEIGREAARQVLAMMEGRPGEDVLFEPEFVARHSTAKPRER